MAIGITISPAAPVASLIPVTVSWTGLTTASSYVWTVVGPQGTQMGTLSSGAGTTATTTWNPDGAGLYSFYTQLVSAVTPVPGTSSWTVEAIN